MPQAGIDPPAQSHATYEASALPPSHHGWILRWSSVRKILTKGQLILTHNIKIYQHSQLKIK